MSTYFELSPAYGRDYKTAKDVKAAWDSYKDFLGDYQLGFQIVNKLDLMNGPFEKPCTVILRYARNTKLVSVKVVE